MHRLDMAERADVGGTRRRCLQHAGDVAGSVFEVRTTWIPIDSARHGWFRRRSGLA
jgi:hypothetical protein